MTTMTIDRCYDRYLISFSAQNAAYAQPTQLNEEDAADAAAHLFTQLLRTVLESQREQGRLYSYRCDEEETPGTLLLDVEAAPGHEEWLAATIDTLSEGMCMLAEWYPSYVNAEV